VCATYDRVDFCVAEDGAILEYRYWKEGAPKPYRVIEAPREYMVERAGHLLPTRFKVTNVIRRATTEAIIHDMDVEIEIDERIFSLRTLEQQRPLPRIGSSS
jgi:hypothetical protein